MRQKKAKLLRRIARQICNQQGRMTEVDKEYKKMKKVYKIQKGEI